MINYLDLSRGDPTSLGINISHTCSASDKADLQVYSKWDKFSSAFKYLSKTHLGHQIWGIKEQLCISMTVLTVQYLIYCAKSYLPTLAGLEKSNFPQLISTELKYLDVHNMEAVFMVHKLIWPSLIQGNSSCLLHVLILSWNRYQIPTSSLLLAAKATYLNPE